MTTNQISYFKAKEEERHNKAVEAENYRSNQAQERLKSQQLAQEKQHYERSDTETQRANLVKERQNAETITQNYTKLAQEQQKINETARSNRANEEINWISANAKDKEARAKVVTGQASAELDYAKAGYTYAQTALTDVEAAYKVAQTQLAQNQADQVLVQIPNTIADTQVKRANRDQIITQTQYIPLNTWSNVLRNLSIGANL